MADWNDFYVATAGASAALTGLIFVGISINLTKILSHKSLPTRASLALILLMSILILSIVLLIPREKNQSIGIILLIAGLSLWLFITTADIKIYRRTDKLYKGFFLRNIFFDQLSVIPYSIGGLLILLSNETGFYWIAVAFIISFIKAASDAWVLLIEILR